MSAFTPGAGDIRAIRPLARRRGADALGEWGFEALALSGLFLSLGILVVLLVDITSSAIPVFQERGLSFLTAQISGRPGRTGLLGALLGSLQIAGITILVAFPVGIATAIYLEEYADDNRFTRMVDINIRNLAGVPSIVYGLLGLAIFVRLLGGITGGRSALAGGLTMATLALPIVVITAAEAIR
ncbi:MAG: phosphate transport system permease protein, partial [Glaciecola sp.]